MQAWGCAGVGLRRREQGLSPSPGAFCDQPATPHSQQIPKPETTLKHTCLGSFQWEVRLLMSRFVQLSLVPPMEQRWEWGGCESYLGSTPALLGQQVDVNLNVSRRGRVTRGQSETHVMPCLPFDHPPDRECPTGTHYPKRGQGKTGLGEMPGPFQGP